MPKVCVPVAEGFEEIEAIAMIDVMRRAKIEVVIAGVTGQSAKGGQGIEVVCDCLIGEVNADFLDMVVLPGGWGGTQILAKDETVQNLLKEMDAKGKQIGAICAAPFALSEAGLIRGEYTCYPGFEEKIGHPEWFNPDKKVIETGHVMTSRGPGTAICFGLAIVAKLVDQGTADALREGLLATYC